jgi:predicted Zn-dependent protease
MGIEPPVPRALALALVPSKRLIDLGQREAITCLKKARNNTPEHPTIRADLAAAYALGGETERAAAELAEACRLSPDDRYSSIARLKAARNFGVLIPTIRALFEATYFAGLRKAGMPEE